jgi:uncharacterized protein
MQLSLHQARVIGCLLEKEVTTPEQYPLSLNALTLACNQKTSRDPLLELREKQVQQALDELAGKRLVSEQSGFGSRVVKYKHRFCNTEFSDLQLSPAAVAIVCLLLLRGPQTAGELRTRSQRLYSFTDIAEVESTLQSLMTRDPALIVQLPREPGRRESRFMELFSEQDIQQPAKTPKSMSNDSGQIERREINDETDTLLVSQLQALTARVAQLERQLQALEAKVASMTDS